MGKYRAATKYGDKSTLKRTDKSVVSPNTKSVSLKF